MKTKNPLSSSVAALIVFPVLFVVLTVVLLYFIVLPAAMPYVNLAALLISSNSAPQTAQQRDLLSAPEPVPVAFPDSGPEGGTAGPESSSGSESSLSSMGISGSDIVMPNPGDLYARLTIEGTVIDAPVYWDDSARELNAGIGTYTGGWLPGFGRTIMLAGHRGSWLRDLGSAQIGGIITLKTHYGDYTYEITDIAVYGMDDSSAYDFSRKDENIIIYTCYPFDYIGSAQQRYFVYGEFNSGMQVDR